MKQVCKYSYQLVSSLYKNYIVNRVHTKANIKYKLSIRPNYMNLKVSVNIKNC